MFLTHGAMRLRSSRGTEGMRHACASTEEWPGVRLEGDWKAGAGGLRGASTKVRYSCRAKGWKGGMGP